MSITTVTVEDVWHLVRRNGKSRVKPFDFLPFVVLPSMMWFAFLSPGCTVLVMAVIAVGVALSYAMFQKIRSQFFFAWTLASGLYLIVQLEYYKPLYISKLEHSMDVLLILSAFWCLYKTRIIVESEVPGTHMQNRSQFFFAWALASGTCLVVYLAYYRPLYIAKLEQSVDVLFVLGGFWCLYNTRNIAESEVAGILVQNSLADSNYCWICQRSLNERFFHCIWLDCCLTRVNYPYFFAGQVLAALALLINSNYCLTNACHSHLTIGGILLPDDCIFAYGRYWTAKLFALSAYALGFMCVIMLSLIHQIVILIPKYYLSSKDVISNTFHKAKRRSLLDTGHP